MSNRGGRGPIIAASMLVLAAVACFPVRYPEQGRPVAAAEGEALAFGRIVVIDRGREIEPWNPDVPGLLAAEETPAVRLSLFRVERDRRSTDARIGPDGSFFWILRPGTYLLYHSQVDQQPPNEPLAAFQIPAGAHAVYLGTMTMHIDSNYDRTAGRQIYSITEIDISDDLERAMQVLAAAYPGSRLSPERKLMISDPSLQSLFRNYSRKACEAILSRHGLKLLGPEAVKGN